MEPKRSHEDIQAELTAEGAPFETLEIDRDGVPVRAWKNAPPSVRAMVENSRAFGDQDFLVYDDERLTYREHFTRVAGLAKELMETYGIAKGDRVAIAMRNYPEWVIAFFAASCTGAIVVPLNAWWTARELEFGLRDSGAKVVIADQERLDLLGSVLPELEIPAMVARPTKPLPENTRDISTVASAEELPAVDLDPEDDATLFYTSGTTGTPKGALGTHRNICGNVVSQVYSGVRGMLRLGHTLAEVQAATPAPMVSLMAVPLFHATGCHTVLMGAFERGGTLVLMYKWEPGTALELMERERVTHFTGVPTMLTQMYNHPDFEDRDLSSLTVMASGGASAAPVLVERTTQLLPAAAPGNGYGLTETSSMTTSNRGIDYVIHPDSVGPPVAICEVEVVDPASREPLPIGEVGELRIKGANVVKGYWNRPDATDEVFVDGWFYSGDLARLDDEGFVYIVDRAKDMIIRGGENVYSAEVEAAIHQHPNVTDCAVIGVEHEVLGEEVGAVVQTKVGSSLTDEELRTFLADRIARFKIPTRWEILEDELPRNAAGKLLKREIKTHLDNAGETTRV
ncbi:long-chain acyl-CoA synthetase [Enteractinococcus fodinae]|uniref:Long-chain acyl-CoA synthetase n=2 Tax=Enteractinococcus fodinae TaxID=684663 RepID=A0ABU2B454_9MICC|nr:long-chain acyl-CoA synthetase [Enteractinococcus fodinae]